MEQTTLVAWVRSVWEKTQDIEKIVDPSLARELSNSDVRAQVLEVLKLALSCIEKDPRGRPTMRIVVKGLDNAVKRVENETTTSLYMWTPPPQGL